MSKEVGNELKDTEKAKRAKKRKEEFIEGKMQEDGEVRQSRKRPETEEVDFERSNGDVNMEAGHTGGSAAAAAAESAARAGCRKLEGRSPGNYPIDF